MDSILSRATISSLYRFALLLTGQPRTAESTLRRVIAESVSQIAQFRSEKHRTAFLVGKIRDAAKVASAPGASGHEDAETADGQGQEDANSLPPRFCALSEPGRSALALFYLNVFPPSELAAFLGIDLEQLGTLLQSGREQLAGGLP